MTLIAMSKIVAGTNVRTVPGVEDWINTPLSEFPQEEREEIISLAESIRSGVLMNPVTVKDTGGGNKFRLIAGYRRFKACQYLGLTQIDAKSIKGKTSDEVILSLSENIHRADMSPIDVARALDRIRQEAGITKNSELASLVCRSTSWVSQMLGLLKADPSLVGALDSREIGLNAARTIAAMPKAEQASALAEAKAESVGAGKKSVTSKSARRQSVKSKREKKDKQLEIRPIADRMVEQRDALVKEFLDVEWGDGQQPDYAESVARMFWAFLIERSRLIIKP